MSAASGHKDQSLSRKQAQHQLSLLMATWPKKEFCDLNKLSKKRSNVMNFAQFFSTNYHVNCNGQIYFLHFIAWHYFRNHMIK